MGSCCKVAGKKRINLYTCEGFGSNRNAIGGTAVRVKTDPYASAIGQCSGLKRVAVVILRIRVFYARQNLHNREIDAFEDALREQFGGHGIDVVLDYLWGPSAERVIIAGAKAGKEAVPIRFVQIGAVSAPNITLPSAAVRSSAITLMGSGIGSLAVDGLVKSIRKFWRLHELC